jgi:hypothetical protein
VGVEFENTDHGHEQRMENVDVIRQIDEIKDSLFITRFVVPGEQADEEFSGSGRFERL